MQQPTNSTTVNSDSTSSQIPISSRKAPPIFIKTNVWRVAAPILFQTPGITRGDTTAVATSNGTIMIKTRDAKHFRLIQKTLTANNIDFISSMLPEDRTLKVVLRGIPTYISPEELKSELESFNFNVKLIKRFGMADKLMTMCLVLLNKESNSKDIYEISELFYLKIKVEAFRKSGVPQCFSCQRFGHSSFNCSHPPRCVKCAGEHKASDCPKTREENPACCNCGGLHTANFRGCPSYSLALAAKTAQTPPSNSSKSAPPAPCTNQATAPAVNITSYAKATKGKAIRFQACSQITHGSTHCHHLS